MACPCEHKAKGGKSCKAGTPPVLKVESVECPVLFHTVVIPASVGTVETLPPTPGAYRNARVTYEADEVSYLYDSDGIPQLLSDLGRNVVESVNGKTGEVVLDANDVGAATPTDINDLQEQIDALSVASDVTDVVGTYADLQAYDTSQLKDNDIIKVLQDEDQNDQTTYYRWDKETELFTLIGAEGPYYTKSAADTKFQDKLTAGSNITIDSDNVISATDTTYTAGTNISIDSDNVISATDTTYTAGTNISIDSDNVISATDTTYSNFVGTDGVDPGVAGLVPAPATTDADKFLKSDGTWAEAGGGTLYTTYGQNEDGAMTQKATTDLVYTAGDPKKINIGDNGVTGGTNSIIIGSEDSGTITGAADQIIIGHNITDGNANSIAIGNMASTGASAGGYYGNAIAIGHYAKATRYDTVAVGSGLSTEDSARATGDKSIAIGSGANSYGNYAVAIGKGSAGAYGLVIGGEGLFAAPTATGGTEGQAIKIGLAGEAYGRAVAIGLGTTAKNGSVTGAVAIGDAAEAIGQSTVALGAFSKPRAKGVVDVGISSNSAPVYDTAGYNNTRYRLISGVHDGEQLHDAATVAQGNTLATSAPTTATAGVLGQLYTDTTAMHTYQLGSIDTTDPSNPVYNWVQRW